MPDTPTVNKELRTELSRRFTTGMPDLNETIREKAADAAYAVYEKAPATDLTILVVYGFAYAYGYSERLVGGWDSYSEMDPRLAEVGGLEPVWDKLSSSKGGSQLAPMAFAAASEILCDIPDNQFGNPFQLECAKFAVTGYMNGYLASSKDVKAGVEKPTENEERFSSVYDYALTFVFAEQTKNLFRGLHREMEKALRAQLSSDIIPRTGAFRQYASVPGDQPAQAARAYAIGLGEGTADALSILDDGTLPEDEERYDASRLFSEDDDGNLSCERLYSLSEVSDDGLIAGEFTGPSFAAAQLVDAKFCRMGMPLVGRLMAIDALRKFAGPLEAYMDQDLTNMDIAEQSELAVLNASANTCFRQMGYGYAAGWRLVFDRKEDGPNA